MSVFEKKIKINPNGYLSPLNKTQESVFNEMLEGAISLKQDPEYNDEQHQIIYMENGDEYYFDSYKYIFPIKAKGHIAVINNNIGLGEIVSVGLYGENMIRVEHYVDDNKMVRYLYELPKSIENISSFLLQISSLHPATLMNLNKISEVTFIKESDIIFGYDEQGNNFYNKQATNSFFEDMILASNEFMKVEKKQSK